MKTDETLVTIYAQHYGWLIAAVRPGERDGAAEVAEAHKRDGAIPYHIEHGSRREREAVLRKLSDEGLILISGNTQARRCGLTWGGVCRAVALTVGTGEIGKAFDIMRKIADHARAAGGSDVSPSGCVPEYLLAPKLGHFWNKCKQGDKNMMFERSKLFCQTLPALVMRWVTVAADSCGRRWYSLTTTGKEALQNQPEIPKDLPEDSPLIDLELIEMDRAWETACRAKPIDKNAVHIPFSCSQWWTPGKGGEA